MNSGCVPASDQVMKILLIEDNPDHAELIHDLVGTAFPDAEFNSVMKLQAGIDCLQQQPWDCLLCDLKLPDSTIQNTVAVLQELHGPVPIVVLTSLGDTGIAAELIRGGIQDYLTKEGLSARLLERVCISAIERKRAQLAQNQQVEEQELFCRSLSHDFRASLRGIMQMTSLLKASLEERLELSEDERRFFQIIETKVGSANELVAGLYGYLQAEIPATEHSDVDLALLVAEVADELRADYPSGTIEVLDPLAMVRGNQAQLHSLLYNLLGNALKFCERVPAITVSSQRHQGQLIITLADNGIGMDADELEKIFTPFVRLSSGRAFSGSGLGLSIAKRVMTNLGGTIRVESEPGGGSRFNLGFPLAIVRTSLPV